jgi:muramoyltetrapeptide carboxypeptidase
LSPAEKIAKIFYHLPTEFSKQGVLHLKTWQPLKAGDIVDVISPGSSSRPEDVELGIELLRDWGLKPRLDENNFSPHPFHSNEDEVRWKILKKALAAKDSKVIWCLRGGYGANRLLPLLSKMKKPAVSKLVVGYSDITSLHLYLGNKWKWTCLHGPLLETLIGGRLSPAQIEETRRVLFGEQVDVSFRLHPLNKAAEKIKKAQAPVRGGNMVVIASALGTKFQPSFKDQFLILEEVGERGYRIDRLFTQMEQSGVLQGCKGIFLGDFLYGDEKDGSNFVSYALERFAAGSKIPVFRGLQSGHGAWNRPVFLGPRASLAKTQNEWELTVPTGLV